MIRLAPASRPRLLGLALAVALASSACVRDNPAFDPDDGFGDDSDEDLGDGDGDPTTGDGDGDPTTGDGDTDPTTGDGDGDTDPTTGDGDGDTDPDPNACLVTEPADDYFPFQVESLGGLLTAGAPSFASAPEDCLLVMVCAAAQATCNPDTPYVAKVYSNGAEHVGQSLPQPGGLQLRFHLGGGECQGAGLQLTQSDSFGLVFWNGQAFQELKARMPCLDEFDVPLYVASNGSTFWDPGLSQAAALW
jgi:hypothetical protein